MLSIPAMPAPIRKRFPMINRNAKFVPEERDAARDEPRRASPDRRTDARVPALEEDNRFLRSELAQKNALLSEYEDSVLDLQIRVDDLEQTIRQIRTENAELAKERDEALLYALSLDEGENRAQACSRQAETLEACDGDCGGGCAGDCAGDCAESCPSFNLCRQRVLIVGGIERMESRYRKLVEEEGGGILEYHAGHMRGGKKQLEKCLQRADVVLCPVNCNSHGACLMVKNLAKKYRKPVHMMPNFSISAVAGVISAHCGSQQNQALVQ